MEELKCVDCGTLPPETESAYTLIGGKAGWRLVRHRRDDGIVVADWRCPECWQRFKKANPAMGGPPGGAPPRAPLRGKQESIGPAPSGRRRPE